MWVKVAVLEVVIVVFFSSWCIPGAGLGVPPPSIAVSWVPTFSASSSLPTTVVSTPATVASLTPAVTTLMPATPSLVSAAVGVPAGTYLGEGLLPVPDKLVQKIVRLEFIEMRDLMPETWLREEDASNTTLSWPRRRLTPVTDILQWLQCYAALVGVLSRAYPTMVPEFMSYQATIIKCARDFDGLAWAQYDRAYRRQVAQTKDLRWSRLNPTLYSLCFAGKAKRHIVCSLCLSDNHASENCPENSNLPSGLLPWHQTPSGQLSTMTKPPTKLCNLFNAREGPRCTFQPCKYAHRCSICRGAHARAFCKRQADVDDKSSGGRGYKRPRPE